MDCPFLQIKNSFLKSLVASENIRYVNYPVSHSFNKYYFYYVKFYSENEVIIKTNSPLVMEKCPQQNLTECLRRESHILH